MSGISTTAEPEVQFTEMVGVEEGSQDEAAVDLTSAINYSLADDPIINDADLGAIRVNRVGVRAKVMDPIRPIPDEEPHPLYDYNHNLIVRPRGGRMDVSIGMRTPKYKNYCALGTRWPGR